MIVFNRPAVTRRVFDLIRAARPPQLFVIADGPRADREGEAALCTETRSIVLDHIDWPCEVRTNLADANLGCTERVLSGLDWVFEQVDRGIIVEDDCLPDPSFFPFCEELLERYATDDRISLISAQNVTVGASTDDASYWFSRFQLIWGWATWRRTWNLCREVSYADWPALRETSWLMDWLGDQHQARCWRALFDSLETGQVDDWSFRLSTMAFRHHMLSISPGTNLVSNLGFGEGGTTTVDDDHALAEMPTSPIVMPLRHPERVEADTDRDQQTFERIFNFMPDRDVNALRWRIWYRLRRAVETIAG